MRRSIAMALLALLGCEDPEKGGVPPTYFSEASTVTVDDGEYVRVAGERLFALGLHAGGGLIYDGVAGDGECDEDTGAGFLPAETNVTKHHAAHAAGANFVYLWGYGTRAEEIIDVDPPFFGKFYDGYTIDRPADQDVVPVFLNRYGEVDLDGYSADRADEMRVEFDAFINRTGEYSPQSKPNLPPVEQVGHMAWHPTFRMEGTGDGSGEMLTDEQATDLARTTNLMIGDSYAYVENRFDRSTPEGELSAILVGQQGDIGEGYEEWLAADDPVHRGYFSAGYDLAHSLVTRRNPGTVVWMWIQGYSFGRGIAKDNCNGKASDAWAAGGFPPFWYLKKEVLSVIAAGATGIVFFGYPAALPGDADTVHKIFAGLSHEAVYGPVLLAPRLDLGVDLQAAGEGGRAHVMARWDAASRRAFLIVSNPGAQETPLALDLPWTVDAVEVLDWDRPGFVAATEVAVEDRSLSFTAPVDSGEIYRITPLFRE